MKHSLLLDKDHQKVIELFTGVFSASEGKEEGETIGNLVKELLSSVNSDDLMGCIACSEDELLGAILFSRMTVPSGDLGFILSPVAVSTNHQKQGIGQALINYGIDHLKSLDVELVLTYGDPKYYAKTGFSHISEDIIKAPQTLSFPHGWLAQSLNGKAIEAIPGKSSCVEPLNHPKYW